MGSDIIINSINKGKEGERELSAKLREYGYEKCRRGQQFNGLEGDDIVGLDGIHIECKRTESLQLHKAMAQSIKDSSPKDLSVVMHRKNRDVWLVTMSLKDWIKLYDAWISD
jgi:hypothetical protein